MSPHRNSEPGRVACARYAFTAPGNRTSQAELVCQRCGHRDHAGHNAALVIAPLNITKLLAGIPLTTKHEPTRIFRKLGPERSEVTGEIAQDARRP